MTDTHAANAAENDTSPIIELTGPAFHIGDVAIKQFRVRQLLFAEFAEVARSVARGENAKLSFTRERIKRQVEAIDKDGKSHTLDDLNISMIPLVYGRQLPELVNYDTSPMGNVLDGGDGISSPMLFQLGTPIKVKTGDGNDEIKELEFSAKTYGDIEAVIAAENSIEQAIELINTCAKPVNSSLQTLPSWAIDGMTMGDGMAITNKVLPRFLG